MLKKSPASDVLTAVFKNADFSYSSLKVSKQILAFFLIQNSFLSSLLMVIPSSSVNMEGLKVENV